MRYEERRKVKRLYWWAAGSNAGALALALLAYDRMVKSMTGKQPGPEYPFLVRLWAGHAALWGLTFVRIARDPESNISLVRYSWAEKGLTSAVVTQAVLNGKAPARMLPFVAATDIVWIPFFLRTWLLLVADERGNPAPPTVREAIRAIGGSVYPSWGTAPGDSDWPGTGPGDSTWRDSGPGNPDFDAFDSRAPVSPDPDDSGLGNPDFS